ncbi:transmembrane protein 270 isoform X1 [Vicugna pacos]|uniref:Transmembrane protein 270 isoform X1 n=1 Tax=Vicugna pacos TaxID=30538 RepID=A0ABM5BP80_VICPA
MEAIPPIRSSLSGTLLVVVRLSTLLFQNRAHLYHFLLLKIILFNHWLSGLTQEARGSRPPPELAACPVGRVLRAGLALMEVPVWLVLRAPRLAWAGMRSCARASGLAPQRLGLSAAAWTDLLLSCLHGLMLVALILLLLVWRLCRKAEHLLRKALQGPGKGVDTTQIPERTQSIQGKLSAEVCEVGLLLKILNISPPGPSRGPGIAGLELGRKEEDVNLLLTSPHRQWEDQRPWGQRASGLNPASTTFCLCDLGQVP